MSFQILLLLKDGVSIRYNVQPHIGEGVGGQLEKIVVTQIF